MLETGAQRRLEVNLKENFDGVHTLYKFTMKIMITYNSTENRKKSLPVVLWLAISVAYELVYSVDQRASLNAGLQQMLILCPLSLLIIQIHLIQACVCYHVMPIPLIRSSLFSKCQTDYLCLAMNEKLDMVETDH